ncbi:hypothetical protein OsJ_17395 [Oryza sativa Japonica Group]|uniref:Uncharacterized protein n=1 Tax=Oryza sativa subsp. japonica TaxID=39947 RepID=B9FMV8_ORYSJ|nr:hypothetical protein OsJ_17395 [Oryza sativa Japonica Group]
MERIENGGRKIHGGDRQQGGKRGGGWEPRSYKDGDRALAGDYSRSGGHLDARASYFGLMKMGNG